MPTQPLFVLRFFDAAGVPMIEQLGPYRIDELRGRGGMGSVYAGTHDETGERAAIKVLSQLIADDGNFRDRFAAEIETLKKLNHPNIVRLIGHGEQDGYLFFVMELVEGDSLKALLQRGITFDWKEAVEVAVQVCAALQHAHDRGIIHRDLKPANLLRASDGQIKLTDFGIAKFFGGTQLTADGSVVGTADYMAPEQAEGTSISNRTDLYSLGSVLYTLLARRPPFVASSVPQVLHKLRFEPPTSVRRYAPQVPAELANLIDELLCKDPEKRVSNAAVLSRSLQAMRHALNADSVIDPGPVSDGSTRVATDSSDSGGFPTAVDEGPEPPAPGYAWNEATVVTSALQQPSAESSSNELASSDTVADAPAPATRYTRVEEEPVRRQDGGIGLGERLQTMALLTGLLAVAAACAWWLWPVSADALYARIVDTVQTAGPADAKPLIDRFLASFPDDQRVADVDLLRRDVESQFLQTRLALRSMKSGGSNLAPFEALCLQALRAVDQDAAAARALFDELIREYGETDPVTPELQACLDAAQHQLLRLRGAALKEAILLPRPADSELAAAPLPIDS